MEVNPIGVRDRAEIDQAITNFARSPHSGLIITGSAAAGLHMHERDEGPPLCLGRALVPGLKY